MKFYVSRTSLYSQFEKPCEEAFPATVIRKDRRTVNDPRKLRNKVEADGWYQRGSNHRVENGQIVRDLEEMQVWAVEINTLEELIAFYEKYGDLVIHTDFFAEQVAIEIYDGYRE